MKKKGNMLKGILLLLFLFVFGLSKVSADTIYTQTNNCAAVTYGTIKEGQKTYGALSKVTVRPGGHYGVTLSYNAMINYNYDVGERCVFIKYQGTNNTSHCKRSWITGPNYQSAPAGWDYTPPYLVLTDDTNNTSVTLKYISFGSVDSGTKEGTATSRSNIPDGSYYNYTVGHWIGSYPLDIKQSADGKSLYLKEEDGSVKDLYTSGPQSDSGDGENYYEDVKCTGNTSNYLCSCPQPTNEKCTFTKVSDGKASCTPNYYPTEYTCKCPDKDSYTCSCLPKIKDYSCTNKCEYRKSCKYIEYFVKVPGVVSESTSGIYVIDEDNPSNGSDKIVGDRFEKIFEKFVSIDAASGYYKYYLNSTSNDFGTRSCDLEVNNDNIPDIYWDNYILFRTVDIDNNLSNVFAGRTPGKNWIKYFYNKNVFKYFKSSQVKPMYEIRLSASTMKKIAKSNRLSDYINWNLSTLMGESKVYNPMTITGTTYSYNSSLDYFSNFSSLRDLGADITVNKDDVIIPRNTELVSNGYNLYFYSEHDNNNPNENIITPLDDSIFRTGVDN